jgi:RNA 3'-terminal phosphate cyclase (ATP)
MIHLDGGFGEGGGQILRTALSLSILTGKPFRIEKIRAKRPTPGLMPQHLVSVRAAREISHAYVEGDVLGSTRLVFEPEGIFSGNYRFDIGTAGSVTLVLQTIYLPLAFGSSPSEIVLTGGTHVPFSPSFHFLKEHWVKLLARIGISLELELKRAGFYPKGGGEILARIHPFDFLEPLVLLTRGPLRQVKGYSFYANLDPSVGERQKRQLEKRLRMQNIPHEVIVEELEAVGPNALSFLVARYTYAQLACESLGARGKPAEKVADEAAFALIREISSNATLDVHVADQLLLPLAVVPGESEFQVREITGHLETLREVIREFLPAQIDFRPIQGGYRIRVQGIRLG